MSLSCPYRSPTWCSRMRTRWRGQTGRKLHTALCLVCLLGFSLLYLRRIGEPFDFRCYYQGARAFYAGESLYFTNDINRTCERAQPAPAATHYQFRTGFYYPPYFGGLMLPFGLLDYALSARVWSVLNIWLFCAALYVLMRMFAAHTLTRNQKILLLLITGSLVFSYVQICLRYGQVQILVLFLLILGFYFLERGRYFVACLCIMSSIYIKFIPVILLSYVVFSVKKPHVYRMMLYSVFIMITTVVFSCFFRNPFLDLQEFFTVLQEKSRVIPIENLNQSFLAGMVRLLTEVRVDNEIKPFINILSISMDTVKWLYMTVAVAVLCGFMALGFYKITPTALRETRFAFYALWIAFITVFSPLAWSHYFVWLLPGIFLLTYRLIKVSWQGEKVLLSLLVFLVMSNIFTSRDLIGPQWNPLLKSYSHIMWSGMAVLLGLAWLIWRTDSQRTPGL